MRPLTKKQIKQITELTDLYIDEEKTTINNLVFSSTIKYAEDAWSYEEITIHHKVVYWDGDYDPVTDTCWSKEYYGDVRIDYFYEDDDGVEIKGMPIKWLKPLSEILKGVENERRRTGKI